MPLEGPDGRLAGGGDGDWAVAPDVQLAELEALVPEVVSLVTGQPGRLG